MESFLNYQDIQSFGEKMNIIEKYTKTIPSKSGQNSYKSNIKSYIRFLKPDTTFEKKHNRYIGIPLSSEQKQFTEDYFKKGRDYKDDVLNFVISLKGTPAKTIKTKLAAVKGWLQYNDVEILQKHWKNILNKIQGSRAVTIDKVPTKKELKKIMSNATVKDRALFLTLISSGMRIGEACKIKLNDIKELPKIKIRAEYTKSGNSRIVFVSSEAAEAINEWKEQRKDYLRVAVTRLNCVKPRIDGKKPERIIKSLDDDRVFPYATSTARVMWNRLIRKAGLDERDPSSGYHCLHVHCLRKYFSGNMNVAGMPSDIVESLIGHEDKLKRIYNLYTVEQLEEIYNKYVNKICISEAYGTDERINNLDEQLNEKDKQISDLERTMQELKAQVIEMRLERIEKANGIKKK